MDVTRTISVPELVWTVVCGLGLIYAIRIMWDAVIDLAVVRYARVNSIREYAALTTIIFFSKTVLTMFGFVISGAVAMTVHQSQHSDSIQVTLGVVFTAIAVYSSITLYLVDKRRHKLMEKIKALETENDIEKLREVIHGSQARKATGGAAAD